MAKYNKQIHGDEQKKSIKNIVCVQVCRDKSTFII